MQRIGRELRIKAQALANAWAVVEKDPSYARVTIGVKDRIEDLERNLSAEQKGPGTSACLDYAITRFDLIAEGFLALIRNTETQKAYAVLLTAFAENAFEQYFGQPPHVVVAIAGIHQHAKRRIEERLREWNCRGYERLALFESRAFDTALICENGHVITPSMESNPGDLVGFCIQCGEKTSSACRDCAAPIRGARRGTSGCAEYKTPVYCSGCGNALPWTARSFKAACDLAAETLMSDEDLRTFGHSLDQLTSDTPATELAVVRVRTILSKATKPVQEGLKNILVAVVSEAVKKQLWP